MTTINKKWLALAMAAIPFAANAQDVVGAPATTQEINFDALRGNAYLTGAFGNMASALTVNDYLAWPHLFGGSKFLYVEPTNESGTAAIPVGGNTGFVNLQNSSGGTPGVTTVGLASTGKFGASFSFGFDKTYTTTNPATAGLATTTVTTIGRGDLLGLNFSMPLGGNALSASASWLTPEAETNSDATGAVKQSFYQIVASVNFSNFPSSQGLVYNAGLTFDRLHIGSTLDSNRWQIRGVFNLGKKVLSNGSARVFLGADQTVAFTSRDDNNTRNSAMGLGLYSAPNLVGEYAFNSNWFVFGGARHVVTLLGYESRTNEAANVNLSDESTRIHNTSATTANVGVRYQRSGFAAEAALSDALFTDGASTLFSTNGAGLLASFGAFLYF